MPHELLFADAARPPAAVVLRLPLRPYSLGHELILLQERNPLLFDESAFADLPAADQRRAVIRAALICARRWTEQDELPPNLRAWQQLLEKHPPNYPLEIAHWRIYFNAAHTCFPAPDPRADDICSGSGGYEPMTALRGRPLGAPHLARLINFVTERDLATRLCGCAVAFDVPYGLANSLYAAHSEAEGGIRIESAAEQQAKAEWDKIVAEARAEEQNRAPVIRRPDATLATPPPAL